MSKILPCRGVKKGKRVKRGKRVDAVNGETLILPEEVIQHIQSFMSGKQAALSTLLSKSWYNAWLTRPNIDLDEKEFFHYRLFEEFAKNTMQRYEGLSLKIESFRLRGCLRSDDHDNLILNAMKLGATDLQLELHWSFTLPQEVLGSETLLRLSVSDCEIDGDYVIRCSRLKSLTLERVNVVGTSERWFMDLMISCCNSLEELKLTYCYGFEISWGNLNELRELRRLYLESLDVDSMFFTDFASRFPCLKDLTLHYCRFNGYTSNATSSRVNEDTVISYSSLKSLRLSSVAITSNAFKAIITCSISMEDLSLSCCTDLALSSTNLYELHKLSRLHLFRINVDALFLTDFASRFPCLKDLTILYCGLDGYTRIQIASTSLETIRFEPVSESQYDTTFEVPNIQKFTYSGYGIPSRLSINVGSSREWEWELNLSLKCTPGDKSWYLDLKKFLTKFRLSRTSLSISFSERFKHDEVVIEVVPEPAVVENLMIDTPPSSLASILYHLFWICRPKFISRHALPHSHNSLKVIYKRLMCDRDLFEKFGLKKVHMQVYDKLGIWRTPLDVRKRHDNYEKVKFELIWD